MGRAALGSAKKSEVISTRVTESCRKEIEERFGSASKFIQAMIKAQGFGEKK